jgi:hypothetical protein
LLFKLTGGQAITRLDEAIRERRLAVINVRDDREISYMLDLAIVFLGHLPF